MQKIFWQLDSLITADGLKLYGIVAHPKKKSKSGIAVIVIHGLNSAFYHGLKRGHALAAACGKAGYGLTIMNNRGHDTVLPGLLERKKGVAAFGGSGFEKFTDCVYDIDATIAHMRRQGYKKIVLVGHSTGANKVAYYLSQKPNRAVIGSVLLSPISDIAGELAVHKKEYKAMIKKVQKMQKDEILVSEMGPFVMSAERFRSMYLPKTAEDMFPYYDPKARWTRFEKISKPLLLCVGAQDEWLDRSAEKYIKAFAAHASPKTRFKAVAIAGANHGFKGKEEKFARTVIQWIKNL